MAGGSLASLRVLAVSLRALAASLLGRFTNAAALLAFSFAPSFLHSLLSFSIRLLPCLLLILSFIFFLLAFYFPPPSSRFLVLPALPSLPNSSLLLIFLVPP